MFFILSLTPDRMLAHVILFIEAMAVQVSIKDLIKCTNFAAIKHRDQRRKDIQKTPYINHPIGEVTNNISSDVCIVINFITQHHNCL